MARTMWVGMTVLVLVMGGLQTMAAHDDGGARGRGFHCSDMSLRGTYGIQIQGTRPVPPPLGGGFETIIGVVVRTYDGAGNFVQVDNTHGSVTGFVPDRPGQGTYEVNPDCSGATHFEPGPGITLEERLVIVDDGDEIRTIVSLPTSVMVSTVQKKMNTR